MKYLIALAFMIAGISAITNPPIKGKTPASVNCPNSLCHSKADGNYDFDHDRHYFVSCTAGKASCQACWPQSLVFNQECNQCLYDHHDACYTTASWTPDVQFDCPDLCPAKGPSYKGNIADPYQPKHYVGCWEGVTRGCVNCPKPLKFNEAENACLYEGKYLTQPLKH